MSLDSKDSNGLPTKNPQQDTTSSPPTINKTNNDYNVQDNQRNHQQPLGEQSSTTRQTETTRPQRRNTTKRHLTQGPQPHPKRHDNKDNTTTTNDNDITNTTTRNPRPKHNRSNKSQIETIGKQRNHETHPTTNHYTRQDDDSSDDDSSDDEHAFAQYFTRTILKRQQQRQESSDTDSTDDQEHIHNPRRITTANHTNNRPTLQHGHQKHATRAPHSPDNNTTQDTAPDQHTKTLDTTEELGQLTITQDTNTQTT